MEPYLTQIEDGVSKIPRNFLVTHVAQITIPRETTREAQTIMSKVYCC